MTAHPAHQQKIDHVTFDRVAAVSKACSSGTACPSDDLVGVWANEWELSSVSPLYLKLTLDDSNTFLDGADCVDSLHTE